MKKKLLICLLIIALIAFLLPKHTFQTNPKISYYETSKIYFAPKSQIRIIVQSKNYTRENSDLGNGTAFVKLYRVNSINDTVYLKTSPENINFIIFRNKKIPFECSQTEKNKLYKYLLLIGFKNINQNEIAELRDAMTLINYGEKTTFLKGQTKFIEVLK